MPSSHSALPIIRERVLTKRLILRPFALDDHKTWFEAQTKRLPKQSPFDWDPQPPEKCNETHFHKMLKRHEALATQDKIYIFGAFLRDGGVLVGALDISVLIRADRQMGNLGYFVHNRHWRQGFGKEIALAALKIGFEQLHLNRLEAVITPENLPSIAVAKAIGMQKEGIRRNYLFEEDQWADQLVFSAIPENIGLKGQRPKIGVDSLQA